jgi:hypothetical protein
VARGEGEKEIDVGEFRAVGVRSVCYVFAAFLPVIRQSILFVFGRFEFLETCTNHIPRQNGLFWSRDMVCRPEKAGVECAETAIEGQ